MVTKWSHCWFLLLIIAGLCNSWTLHGSARVRLTCPSLRANPVTAEANRLGSEVNLQEALLWFDEANLNVRAGSGGAGASTYRLGKNRQQLSSSGGSGGTGGSVVLLGSSMMNTLLKFKGNATFRAENGKDGDYAFQNGQYGADRVVEVPVGCTVYDVLDNSIIGELTSSGERLVVATGGKGGQGNAVLHKARRGHVAGSPPEGGQRRNVRLEMQLVADIGLVGVPNAGKSTLLDRITNARPKIASYPFTTIVPNLGVCDVAQHLVAQGRHLNARDAQSTVTIADIPGLLEGAHRGIGLGRGFLRHIEKCRVILHLVNGASADPIGDFNAINRELQLYSPALACKPQIVVLNKLDLPQVLEQREHVVHGLRQAMSHSRLLEISAQTGLGVSEMVERSWRFLSKITEEEDRVEQ